jgi:hypothetical protein
LWNASPCAPATKLTPRDAVGNDIGDEHHDGEHDEDGSLYDEDLAGEGFPSAGTGVNVSSKAGPGSGTGLR